MDREALAQHLAQAEKHVALGERCLARQRALLAELERDGHDTSRAKALLAGFEETQTAHRAYRDRVRRQLAREHRPSHKELREPG